MEKLFLLFALWAVLPGLTFTSEELSCEYLNDLLEQAGLGPNDSFVSHLEKHKISRGCEWAIDTLLQAKNISEGPYSLEASDSVTEVYSEEGDTPEYILRDKTEFRSELNALDNLDLELSEFLETLENPVEKAVQSQPQKIIRNSSYLSGFAETYQGYGIEEENSNTSSDIATAEYSGSDWSGAFRYRNQYQKNFGIFRQFSNQLSVYNEYLMNNLDVSLQFTDDMQPWEILLFTQISGKFYYDDSLSNYGFIYLEPKISYYPHENWEAEIKLLQEAQWVQRQTLGIETYYQPGLKASLIRKGESWDYQLAGYGKAKQYLDSTHKNFNEWSGDALVSYFGSLLWSHDFLGEVIAQNFYQDSLGAETNLSWLGEWALSFTPSLMQIRAALGLQRNLYWQYDKAVSVNNLTGLSSENVFGTRYSTTKIYLDPNVLIPLGELFSWELTGNLERVRLNPLDSSQWSGDSAKALAFFPKEESYVLWKVGNYIHYNQQSHSISLGADYSRQRYLDDNSLYSEDLDGATIYLDLNWYPGAKWNISGNIEWPLDGLTSDGSYPERYMSLNLEYML